MNKLETHIDDITRIKNLDKSNMCYYLCSVADDTLKSYEKTKKNLKLNNINNIGIINNIIGAGMGGSGMPHFALQYLFKDELSIPYVISQDYNLPNFANSNTVLIAISDSGNTEEIISQYYQARDRNVKIVAIGQGGKLIEMAKRDNIPYFVYSSPVPARASFGFMFGSVLAFLENMEILRNNKKDALLESIEVIEKLNDEIGINIPTKNNIAKKIAILLINRVPILYIEPPFGSLGHRFTKIFSENAEMFAFYNQFPEFRHNDIMSWTSTHNKLIELKSRFIPILLRDDIKNSKMEEEINEVKKLFSSDVIELRAIGKSKISRFYYLLYLTDMIAYYMAILVGKDPSITPVLKQLKDKLRSHSILPFPQLY